MRSRSKLTVALIGALWLESCVPACHRSDRLEIAWFAEHRTEFENLRERFTSDPRVDAVGYETTPRDSVLLESDLKAYRDALRRLGVSLIVKDHGDPARIRFVRTSGGDLGSGTSKGFEWSPLPLNDLEESLDRAAPQRNRILYRRIDEHWYLYFHYYN